MTALIKTTEEIRSKLSRSTKPIGFVATMGALHAGHDSLIKSARKNCKTVVVSDFVNPLQFGPSEDFKEYPRDLEDDLKKCEENSVDFIFAPDEKEIYPTPESRQALILPPKELTSILCGKRRPVFFQGVVTIVKRLFDIIQPDISYWGEKDLQQVYVIRWLVNEYKFPIQVTTCPTVREINGLACSSRNRYLTEKQKETAGNLYKSLTLAKQNIRTGIFSVSKSILESLVFLSQFSDIRVEYFEAKDKKDLGKVDENQTHGFYYLLAAQVAGVRLIDNIEVI